MTRMVKLPPPELIQLSELHDAYRREHRRCIPPEWFCFEVGAHIMPLPEHQLDNPNHLPVIQLGQMGGFGLGWQLCDFMFVLPAVSEADILFKTCLSGHIGDFLRDQLVQLGFEYPGCRVTHALRFPLPKGKTSYTQRHKDACAPYVRADCYACDPKVIVTFGADPLKALFGRDAKLDNYRGAVHEWQGIKVVPTVSPYVFSGSLAGVDVFQKELFRAQETAMRGYVPGVANAGALPPGDWRILNTVEQVEQFEAFLRAENLKRLAIDCEFGNDTGRDEDNYLLTMQIAWGAEKAAIAILRDEGGKRRYSEEERDRINASLTRMMNRAEVKLGGHHLRTDVEMPSREGICFDDKLENGFDTMLAYHLLHGGGGDEGQGLDHLTRKYIEHYGCYWKPLEDWLDSEPTEERTVTNKKGVQKVVQHKRSRKEILRFGYRDIPYELLIPYALKDASGTWIAWGEIENDLAKEPKLKALFENVVMPASLHLMDVQRQGIKQDRQRVKELRELYQPLYEEILAEFRQMIRWDNFNPASKDQKAYLLFGKNNNYRDRDLFVEKHGHEVPKDAALMDLTPLYNTDKYPKEWVDIVMAGDEKYHFPSTKSATIDLLWNDHKDNIALKLLKQLSVLGKFLSTYLLDPQINEFGVPEAGKNICNNIWKNGRAHGNLHQTSETGRYRMSAANLQTNPKKQEDAALAVFVDRLFDGMTLEEYRFKTNDKPDSKCPPEQRIPKEDRINIPTFKSSFVPEEGHVLIEVDFKTAELAVLAYCSGDQALIDIIEQERDLHAEVACRAFKLPLLDEMKAALEVFKTTGEMKPYKKWLKSLKDTYSALRDAAKTVNFGIMYGRGEYALAREISKTGRLTTPEECAQIILGFSTQFPKAWAWIAANKQSAIENEWVETAGGRRRYFTGIKTMPMKDQKAAEREAANSPIQGCVADLLAVAGVNLYRFRYRTDLGKQIGFRVLLPIHDAFLIEVKTEYLAEMKKIIKLCMSTLNRIPGTDKSIGCKIEVFRHRWGVEDEEVPEKKAA